MHVLFPKSRNSVSICINVMLHFLVFSPFTKCSSACAPIFIGCNCTYSSVLIGDIMVEVLIISAILF